MACHDVYSSHPRWPTATIPPFRHSTIPPASLTLPLLAVDSYEFSQLEPTLQEKDMIPGSGNTDVVETKPMFHEWATVLPGMVCLARKQRNATFRNYVAAETATPVIGCAALQPFAAEKNFYFAGVCRSKTIRPLDDGVGPTVDEFFTLAIGGLVTMLNTSSEPIYGGDIMEWTFYSESTRSFNPAGNKRQKSAVRRIGVKVADPLSDKVIGRAMGFAKPGEMVNRSCIQTQLRQLAIDCVAELCFSVCLISLICCSRALDRPAMASVLVQQKGLGEGGGGACRGKTEYANRGNP